MVPVINQGEDNLSSLAHIGAHVPGVDRELVYGWLAGLFAREPDCETLSAYESKEGAAFLDELSNEATLCPTVKILRKLLEGEPKQVALGLAVVFGKLFYGVDGPKTISPYESAYISARGTLFQESFTELNTIIKQLGLSVADTFKEPSDHISVELTVMSEMAGRLEAAAGTNNVTLISDLIDKQRSFLDAHLLVWLPEFRDGCLAREPASLYAIAAESALAYTRQDRIWLDQAAIRLPQPQQ